MILITDNRSVQKSQDKKKTTQGGCQEADRAAGISGKIWVCFTCDNYLPSSSYVWAIELDGKIGVLSELRRNSKPSLIFFKKKFERWDNYRQFHIPINIGTKPLAFC